jgi:ribonucleotide monophosphatase NagD (HAD superfamily)
MGKECGITTGIVLTGVTGEGELREAKSSPIQPDFVFDSIADVKNLLIGG